MSQILHPLWLWVKQKATHCGGVAWCHSTQLFVLGPKMLGFFGLMHHNLWECRKLLPTFPRIEIIEKIKTNKMIGKVLTSPVAHAQPITGGKAPAAPPITMFCGVRLLSQIV